METTDRPNLSEAIAVQVRELIVLGELEAGGRINEVHLAERLEISRTPLREALNFLAAQGYLTVQPRKGFFVKPLSVEEVKQLYPLRGLLDPEALRLAGFPGSKQMSALRKLNQQISKARGVTRVIDLDDQWHRLLLSHCPNKLLLKLIDDFIWKTRRYESIYLSGRKHVTVATDEHQAILDALERQDMEGACGALLQNMSSAREPLIAWLEAREQKTIRE